MEAEVAAGAAELSLGDYVLSGGELAAAVVIDAIARLLPGVLGHEDSNLRIRTHGRLARLPAIHASRGRRRPTVPEVLLGGDHAAIRRWRLSEALGRTWLKRPDLLARRVSTPRSASFSKDSGTNARPNAEFLKYEFSKGTRFGNLGAPRTTRPAAAIEG